MDVSRRALLASCVAEAAACAPGSRSIEAQAAEVFSRNRVNAFGGAFHRPAREYPGLFSWDSGYHALALRRLDAGAALEELATLYSANRLPSGLIAHEQPLPGEALRTRLVEIFVGPIYRSDGRSWMIDPPVAAFAAARLFAPGDPERLRLLQAATDHVLAMDRMRGVTGVGLPAIVHPLESGTDASPLFDPLVDASSGVSLLNSHRALAASASRIDGAIADFVSAGHRFIVSDPVSCGWCLLALEELSRAWGQQGDAAQAASLDRRASELAHAILSKTWLPEEKIFGGYDHVGGRVLSTPTLGGVIAASSQKMIDAGVAAPLVAAHLNPATSAFWGASGLSFNPLASSASRPTGALWRGDVTWGATQYWAHLALIRNGRAEDAARVRVQLETLIGRSGFREYYSATSGAGHGAGARGGFTWPALVLEMRANEEG